MEHLTAIATNNEDVNLRLSRRMQVAEMLVLLALYFASTLVDAFGGSQGQPPLALAAWGTAARCLPLTALLLFLLRRNGEPRFSIGLQFRWWDLILGLLLYVPFDATMVFSNHMFAAAGLRYDSVAAGTTPQCMSGAGTIAFAATSAVIVVWEEPFFRGYLLLRLKGIGTGPLVAVVASALLFALEHLYQGMLGVAVAGVAGLVLALVYLWRRNLTAPMALHFLALLATFGVLPTVSELLR